MQNTTIHKDFFSLPSLALYRASGKFQEFRGSFFRSTMALSLKLKILDEFLAKGDVAELTTLISIFKEDYQVEDIPKRNKEWRCYYRI